MLLPLVFPDGVRLKKTENGANVFISGVYNPDDIHATSLTLLMGYDVIKTDMTYTCTIAFTDGEDKIQVVKRDLNITRAGSQT